MDNIIFLDIDGVLNNNRTMSSAPSGCIGIGNSLLDNLYHIVKETNAKIVLSSTWKKDWDRNPNKCKPDGLYLNKKLRQKNIFIFDKIDDNISLSKRGCAINKYLKQHPEIKHYLILDDWDFDFNDYPHLLDHFIYIDVHIGLTKEHIQQGINILRKD